MTRLVRRAVLFYYAICWAAAFAAAAPARALELDGAFTQGGLVIGQAAPGAKVFLEKRSVRVAPDGTFVIGFGRNASKQAVLTVLGPDGAARTRTLRIAPRRYKVTRIDGLPARQVTPKPEDLKRIRADSAAIKQARGRDTAEAYFRSRFAWPVVGRVSGVYGSQRILNGKPRSPHGGIDIAAPAGTPVRAMADGVVALVRRNMFFTGKTVMIDHGFGLLSVYAHMSAITVKKGAAVRKGQRIGRVGATGRATAPHLHWGVSWFTVRLDPALVAGPMPKAKAP